MQTLGQSVKCCMMVKWGAKSKQGIKLESSRTIADSVDLVTIYVYDAIWHTQKPSYNFFNSIIMFLVSLCNL